MPVVGTLTMILTNVGLSIFNNIRSWKTNETIREKQKAFGEAKSARERERMWECMQSGHKFSEEIEEQLHRQRIDELNTGFERTITRLFYTQNINTWPLNTLPIVLKNGLTVTDSIKIPMLCIFAPSNDKAFNKSIYPQVDMELAGHFDNYYSINSSHNVLYLSRGWKSGQAPTGAEIDQLKTNLYNLPVLLVYPFFEEIGISFIINIWGMQGQSNAEEMVLKPQEDTFSYPILKTPNDPDYEDFVLNTTEEFSIFLKAFIGYVADTYYWQLYGEAPLLPSVMKLTKYVGTDAYERDYKKLLSDSLSDDSIVINDNRRLANLFNGTAPCLEPKEKDNYIRECLSKHCLTNAISPEVISKYYEYRDIPSLRVLEENASNESIKKVLKEGIELIDEKGALSFFDIQEFPFEKYISISEDIYDISTTINLFSSFVKDNSDRLIQIHPSLYIEEIRFNSFLFHLYDNTTRRIVSLDNGFDYRITCKSLLFIKQIKDIFKQKERASLVCGLDRIPTLLSRIHSETLIF